MRNSLSAPSLNTKRASHLAGLSQDEPSNADLMRVLLEVRDLLLEQRRPAVRDEADETLLRAIATSVIGTRFTSAEVLRHAKTVEDLAAALLAADVDNAIQLGLLFKRMAGWSFDGVRLELTDGVDREGNVWRFAVLQGLQE